MGEPTLKISADLILVLTMLLRNLLETGLKSLEGKTLDEVKAMSADGSLVRKLLMEEVHSTD